MAIDHDDVENAFMFVNLTRMYGNQVILCKRTGRMFYISELGDSDELPGDIDASEDDIEIPDKRVVTHISPADISRSRFFGSRIQGCRII